MRVLEKIKAHFSLQTLPLVSFGEAVSLPTRTGVYFIISKHGRFLYAGLTSCLRYRVITHNRRRQFERLGARWVIWLAVSSINFGYALEDAAIRDFRPMLNRTPLPKPRKPGPKLGSKRKTR